MNLLDKIRNDFKNLTKEDMLEIEKDQILIDALVEAIPKNLDNLEILDIFTEELIKKVFFIEPIFTLFMELIKKDDEEEFFNFIFSDEGFYAYITPENEELAFKAISSLQEKYFDQYIKRLEDKNIRIRDISNMRIINHIIKNKLYFRASSIKLDSEIITPEIEDFLIEALENDNEIVLSSMTPRIKQYCIDNNCFYRVIGALNPKDPEDLNTIRDALENGIVTYEQFKNSSIHWVVINLLSDSDFLIISQLFAGDYITEKQKEYVASNPTLINKIVDLMVNLVNRESVFNFNTLADKVPEIKIAFIKYDLECLSGWTKEYYDSTLLYYLQCSYEETLNLYNLKRDYFIDAVNYYMDNNVDKISGIADSLLLDDNFVELRDVVFSKLANVDYSKLLLDYVKSSYLEEKKVERIIEYIDLNKISLVLDDVSILNDIKDFNVHIRLLKGITFEQLTSGQYRWTDAVFRFDEEQRKEFMRVIIDLVLKNKSNYLDKYIDTVVSYTDPQDLQRMVAAVDEISMSFNSILQLRQIGYFASYTYEELVEMFKTANVIDGNSFSRIVYTINKDNIHFIKWMLESPVLNLEDPYLFSNLTNLRDYFMRIRISDEYDEILKEFFVKVGNVPADYTYFYDDETIQKATLDCHDEYYTNKVGFFRINRGYDRYNYFNVLYDRIRERVLSGKDVTFELFAYCLNNISNEKIENPEEILNSGHLLWDNTDTSIRYLTGQLKSPIYNNYIREKFIPIITSNYLDANANIDALMTFNPEFLNRIKELITQKEKLNWYILKIVKYADDPLVMEVLNSLYDNDLISFSNITDSFFQLNHPFIDKCIKNKIITTSYLLEKYVKTILNRFPQFEKDIVEQVQYMDSFLYMFVFEGIENYPLYFDTVLKAFSNGKVLLTSLNQYFFNPKILKVMLGHNPEDIEKLITFLIHNFDNPSKEAMDVMIPYICNAREFNIDNYKYLYRIYGNSIIHLIDDENFKYLCNQDRKNIEKLVKLLEPRSIDKAMIEGINNSIRQNIFGASNDDIINVYTTLVALIQNGKLTGVIRENYIQMLAPAVPEGIENIIIKTGDEKLLQLYKSDKALFIDYLFDCMARNQNLFLDTMKAVTNNYINIKRNEFAAEDNIFRDTNIKYIYDQKSLMDALFKELLANRRRTLLRYLELPFSYLRYTPEEYDFGDGIIDYYTLQFLFGKDLTQVLSKEDLVKVKKNIGVLKNRFVTNVVENTRLNQNLPNDLAPLLDDPEFESRIKKILILPKRERNLTVEMSKLNVQAIMENVMDDEDKYNMLLETIKKFGLLDWGDLFEPGISKLSIASEVENLYSFLNAFSQIYDSEKKNIIKYKLPKVLARIEEMRAEGVSEEEIEKYREKELRVQFSAYKILKYCSIYSSIPNCYKVLLGMEDFDIIKRNETPNASSKSVLERMKRVSEVYLKALKQQEVTIPSVVSDVTLATGKKLRVIVGNRAHPRNMSHGERTGACMRALGHADQRGENDLFEFSATNINGFHITFVDPVTDEYVSRVSGFRNGNTIFLNQLRNVVKDNRNYTDENVIEAMKLVGQQLIELSKDSDFPIENVVASPCYALEHQPTQYLSDINIGLGVYTGYKDVTYNAVVLATTGKDGIAVPLDIGDPSRHPHYKCARIYPVELKGNISDRDKIKLQRITAIKKLLEHEDDPSFFEGIDIDVTALEEELVYTIIGQDWFITLNSRLEIISDIIPLDERAQVEFDEAMERIEAIKESLIQNNSMVDTVTDGGLKNG